ncbi:MAG TPA: DinB family protein [Bacteroidia bacterium]|nr:DinB family protein [Bacteroidia bacterium]
MEFSLSKSLEILQRTPVVLSALLENLSEEWAMNNEGPETWSAFDVIGHLVHGEQTDWIERTEIILSDDPDKRFKPFDRFAQYEDSKGKTLNQLLTEFSSLRKKNIDIILSKNLRESDFDKKGVHPKFGEVTLGQLLATWAVHDLNHLAQISRVMANQYEAEVGPWKEYLRILQS